MGWPAASGERSADLGHLQLREPAGQRCRGGADGRRERHRRSDPGPRWPQRRRERQPAEPGGSARRRRLFGGRPAGAGDALDAGAVEGQSALPPRLAGRRGRRLRCAGQMGYDPGGWRHPGPEARPAAERGTGRRHPPDRPHEPHRGRPRREDQADVRLCRGIGDRECRREHDGRRGRLVHGPCPSPFAGRFAVSPANRARRAGGQPTAPSAPDERSCRGGGEPRLASAGPAGRLQRQSRSPCAGDRRAWRRCA